MRAFDRSCSAPKTSLCLSDLIWASGSKLYASFHPPGLGLKTLRVGAAGLFGGKRDKLVGLNLISNSTAVF